MYNYEEEFKQEQLRLADKINLSNSFDERDIKYISGVDLAYWHKDDKEYAVCCIVTVDYKTHEIVEKQHYYDEISVPYIAGYLSFRELPLIKKTYALLKIEPDIVMFDGNGYLHYRNMGIATHASLFINKPTIGIAKSYLKVDNVDFTMPDNYNGAYTDIIIKDRVFGRALRTHKDVKPIFVSCGNYIDLETAMDISLKLVDKQSRLPVPVRYADLETHLQRSAVR